jgi:hypothetical protein
MNEGLNRKENENPPAQDYSQGLPQNLILHYRLQVHP